VTKRTVVVHYYARLEGWNAKLRRDGVHVTIGQPHLTVQDAFRLAQFLALVADGADRDMLQDALDDWGKNPAVAVAEAEAILGTTRGRKRPSEGNETPRGPNPGVLARVVAPLDSRGMDAAPLRDRTRQRPAARPAQYPPKPPKGLQDCVAGLLAG